MKKRIIYIDILNIIAIISVIAMHHNGLVHGNPRTKAWDLSLVIECLCYYAVPLFIIISGYNLLDYREKYSTQVFFKKRLLKVLIPFIIWALIMFVWKIVILKTMQPFTNFKDCINAFFENKEESTYYFIWCILGCYLTIPLLSLIAKKENIKTIGWIIFLFFIINSLIPNILGIFKINYNKDATILLGGWSIFLLIGYFLKNVEVKKKYRIIIYLSAIIGVIFRFVITFLFSKNKGVVDKTVWGYTSWHSILLASAVFLLIKSIFEKKIISEKIASVIAWISSCSFGVYLMHKIVMHYEITLFGINTASWQWRILGVILTYLICLIIVSIIKKIPILNRIVP